MNCFARALMMLPFANSLRASTQRRPHIQVLSAGAS